MRLLFSTVVVIYLDGKISHVCRNSIAVSMPLAFSPVPGGDLLHLATHSKNIHRCHSDRSGQSFSSLAKQALAAQRRNLSSIHRASHALQMPSRFPAFVPG
jgi:hypothetical protein